MDMSKVPHVAPTSAKCCFFVSFFFLFRVVKHVLFFGGCRCARLPGGEGGEWGRGGGNSRWSRLIPG